jgi:threonine dehydrogenase-like Zn-dependent dehydrogenase
MSQLTYQKELGLKLGAHETICAADHPDLGERMKTLTGARRYRPLIGRPVFTGGFDQVFDCVGTAESLQDAFYYTRARGTIVLVGAPGELPGLDWTFVWARELTIRGALGYGVEHWQGQDIRTFDLTMQLMTEKPLPVESLITHHFPLERYTEAIEANLDRKTHKSVKTVFTPAVEV